MLSGIKKVEVERTRQAFDLDLCSFDFGFGEVIENARTHERHNERNDGDDDEDLD